MRRVAGQIKPLLLKSWWLSKRSPIKSLFCYVFFPLAMMTVCLSMSYLMFSIADVASHSEPTFSEPSLLSSQAFLQCAANKSNPSPTSCGFGAALNESIYPGSASSEVQRRLFLEWTIAFQLSVWEFRGLANFTLFDTPEAMEREYMLPDSRLVGGVVLDFSAFPSHVASDIRMSASILPAPITPSKPSLFFPSTAEIVGGAAAFQRSGFTWLQLRVDSAIALAVGSHSSLSIPDLCANNTYFVLPAEFCNQTVEEPIEISPSFETLPPFNNTENITTGAPNSNISLSDLTGWPIMMNVSSGAWSRSKLVSALFLVIIPACLSWVFLGAIYLTIYDMVGDRVSKLKEYLKIMGMREASYWLANIARMAILLAPVLFVLTLGCLFIDFFGSAGNTAMGVLIMCLFTINTFAFALIVAAVAPSTSIATFVTVLYFFIPLIASFLVNLPSAARYALALFAPFNFQWAIIQLVKVKAMELIGYSVRETPSGLAAISDYSLGGAVGFFILDTLLYTFLAWYFTEILGGSDDLGGAPKPWYFLFTKDFWFQLWHGAPLSSGSETEIEFQTLQADSSSDDLSTTSSSSERNPAHFEPHHGRQADLRLRLRKLVKHYNGADVNAVNGIDLDIFKGIFVLLGENGSGKSTTISMLSGLLPITSGSAEVDGRDLSTQLEGVRDSISICPQHDLLSDRLTGAEHLRLFGILKGVPSFELDDRITTSLHDVGLQTAGDKLVEAYSGGMKRSLSLAISLIANSRVVFIDEASSGMDMEKRRSLWDMLLRKKHEGSTLVLTTHYMEEAEILGDRIGIMHRGNLVREGSVDFLKRELGYQIHTSGPKFKSDSASSSSSSPSPSPNHLYHAESVHVELLPLEHRDELSARLRTLESEFEHVSVTTPNLEEVFLQIGRSLDKASLEQHSPSSSPSPASLFTSAASSSPSNDESSSFESSLEKYSTLTRNMPRTAPRVQQALAYWKKRTRAESRHLSTIFCFLLIPVIITAIALAFTQASTNYMIEIPKSIQAARATDEPVSITFGLDKLPLQIPYVSVEPDLMLDVWNAAPGLDVKRLGQGTDLLSSYLWNGANSKLATLGGIAVLGNQTVSTAELSQTDLEFVDAELDTTIVFNITSYSMGVQYNQTETYSLVSLINFIDNAIAARYLNMTSFNLSNPFIRSRSVPFPTKTEPDNRIGLILLASTFVIFNSQFAFLVCMAFAILGGQIGKQVTDEMERQIVPQMQRIGFASSTFWVSNILFNLARMTIAATLTLSVVAFFQEEIFVGVSFLPLAMSVLMQAWTSVFLAVLLAKAFTNAATAQRFIHLVLCMLAMLPSALQIMLAALASRYSDGDNFVWTISNYTPLFSPLSTFVSVIKRITDAYMVNWATPTAAELFKFSGVGMPLLVQFLYLAASILALFIIEWYKSKIRIHPIQEPIQYTIPEAVTSTEHVDSRRVSVDSMVSLGEEDALMDVSVKLEHLWKRYENTSRRSVVDTTLAVPRGMCFGLLGPNGAGKSTTISMLIGDVSPSGGTYSLDGIEAIGRNRNDLYERVRLACCLQIDSLYQDMTVKEHVELFLALRNHLRDIDVQRVTYEILAVMKLLPHVNKLASQLSGGNKRKLCTALAALTSNSIVFLDEPSAGCDPSMRRTLWSVLASVQSNKAIILTTHSMDEADACCNRIGIMVNGQIVSLGTPQALKEQCGGYELHLTIPPVSLDSELDHAPLPDHDSQVIALENDFLRPRFPAMLLVDRDLAHDGSLVLKYDIGLVPSIANAFDLLHAECNAGRFVDYSLSQMTLATAYQRLVRQQSESTH